MRRYSLIQSVCALVAGILVGTIMLDLWMQFYVKNVRPIIRGTSQQESDR